MKNKKLLLRIISLILALTTVFSAATYTFAAAPAETEGEVDDGIVEEVPEMTVAEEVVAVARSKAGYYDSNINEFTTWYYGTETDAYWCCIFVSWCASQAGAIGTAVPKRASCDSMRKWFDDRGRYYPADSDYVPVKGDIAFLNTAGDGTDDIHHVEIITEDGFIRRNGVNYIRAIGGNTSNINYQGSEYVQEKTRPVNSSRADVVGYCHPDYESSDSLMGLLWTMFDLGSPDFVRFIYSKVLSVICILEGFGGSADAPSDELVVTE